MNRYCLYYQTHVEKQHCWYFTAVLRSFEHVSFDRTIDVENSVFEVFVPAELEQTFLTIMSHFQDKKIISDLIKLPNRIASEDAAIQ